MTISQGDSRMKHTQPKKQPSTKEGRSLKKMLDIIGPYLPEPNEPVPLRSSNWRLAQDDICEPTKKEKTSTGSKQK